MRPFSLILVIATLAACAPAADRPVASPKPTDAPAGEAPAAPSPAPSEAGLRREAVFLQTIDLLTLESYPLQFTLMIKGELPTPCHNVRVEASPPDADRKIAVEVYSVVNPTIACIQVIEPFELNYLLGSYPSGRYTLWVNGEQVAEFDA